jgi:hypothetical protein
MELPVMLLRHTRWLVAGIAAVAGICLAPARSYADVTILVQELDAGGNPISGTSQTFGAAGGNYTNGQFFSGSVGLTTNSSSTPTSVASMTPVFNGILNPTFDVGQDHKLRITATDTSFKPNGLTGNLQVKVSGSNGLATGTESLVEDTFIYNPLTNSPIDNIKNNISPNGDLKIVTKDISGLTNPTYAIQQTLTISFSGTIPANATFGATGGASVTSNSAVPAPGGLALALVGLPLIGLRRAIRKRAAAV